MTPISIKVPHDQTIPVMAKKAGAKIDQLMKAQTDAIFTYAWEPNGTRCAVQAICGGTFIVQCNVSVLEKEISGQGMIMDSVGGDAKKEADMLAKVEKMFAGLVAGKKKK